MRKKSPAIIGLRACRVAPRHSPAQIPAIFPAMMATDCMTAHPIDAPDDPIWFPPIPYSMMLKYQIMPAIAAQTILREGFNV